MKSANYFTVITLSLFCSCILFSQPTGEYTSDANTVLLLHLNETTGNTAYDASSYGNNGTIYGNAPSEGKFFGGRQFPTNNTDIGIQLPNSSSLNITGPLTIEAWIKADNYEMGGTFIIRHDEYQLNLGSFGGSGHLQFSRHVGNQWMGYQADELIPLNEWVHIAGVWDGSDVSLYINGISVVYTPYQSAYIPIGTPVLATYAGSVLNPTTITLVDEIRISDIARVTSVNDNTANPISDYRLSQNYPNPFNPSTTIRFQIPELSFVTLKVYDVLGSEVSMLVNEEKPAGNYELKFEASNLPSGIYFYRLQTGDFLETKKMILIK